MYALNDFMRWSSCFTLALFSLWAAASLTPTVAPSIPFQLILFFHYIYTHRLITLQTVFSCPLLGSYTYCCFTKIPPYTPNGVGSLWVNRRKNREEENKKKKISDKNDIYIQCTHLTFKRDERQKQKTAEGYREEGDNTNFHFMFIIYIIMDGYIFF